MGLTPGDLATYVGAAEGDGSFFIPNTLTQAQTLVADYVGSAVVPEAVMDVAVLNVGSELYHRRNAPSGISQFAVAGEVSPVRLARDPLTSVYPLLARYVGLGVA